MKRARRMFKQIDCSTIQKEPPKSSQIQTSNGQNQPKQNEKFSQRALRKSRETERGNVNKRRHERKRKQYRHEKNKQKQQQILHH